MDQQRVVVTNVDIGFLQLVWLLMKLVLAAIPAAIAIGLLLFFWAAYMSAIFNLFS